MRKGWLKFFISYIFIIMYVLFLFSIRNGYSEPKKPYFEKAYTTSILIQDNLIEWSLDKSFTFMAWDNLSYVQIKGKEIFKEGGINPLKQLQLIPESINDEDGTCRFRLLIASKEKDKIIEIANSIAQIYVENKQDSSLIKSSAYEFIQSQYTLYTKELENTKNKLKDIIKKNEEKQDAKLLDEIKQYQTDIELYQKMVDALSLRLESVKAMLKEREEKIKKIRIVEYPKEVKVDIIKYFNNEISLRPFHYNIIKLINLSERYLKKYLQTAPNDNKAQLELKRIIDEKSNISEYLSFNERSLREYLNEHPNDLIAQDKLKEVLAIQSVISQD